MLGIPTVQDRLIQQAILQVLQPKWDPTFSEHSYGFRPGRRAHWAVRQAQRYIAEGRRWVVDIDLEKFFDRVNHDVLMARVARRVKSKPVLRLIRRYLEAGIMAGDRIMKFGEYDVNDINDFATALSKFKPGNTVKVVVKRGEKTLTRTVTLARPK